MIFPRQLVSSLAAVEALTIRDCRCSRGAYHTQTATLLYDQRRVTNTNFHSYLLSTVALSLNPVGRQASFIDELATMNVTDDRLWAASSSSTPPSDIGSTADWVAPKPKPKAVSIMVMELSSV